MSKKGRKKKGKSKSEAFKKLRDQSNLVYDDIQELVEYLVETNAYKYTFDGFSTDDIGQEIRKKCFLLLEKWNNKKGEGNPIWFFGLSVQNHLKNLHRDHNIKNPNYNPEDKFHTKSLNVFDIGSSNASAGDENLEFAIMSQEVREKLNPKYVKYYDQMMETFSTRDIPVSAKKKIFQKMRDVMGEEGPIEKMNFSSQASYISSPKVNIQHLNVPSGHKS